MILCSVPCSFLCIASVNCWDMYTREIHKIATVSYIENISQYISYHGSKKVISHSYIYIPRKQKLVPYE